MKRAVFTGLVFHPREDVDARIFQLDPPLEGYEFVRVSATTLQSLKETMTKLSNSIGIPKSYLGYSRFLEAETYIFGCDASGENFSSQELEGSYRGGTSHAQALLNAGYEIVTTDTLEKS